MKKLVLRLVSLAVLAVTIPLAQTACHTAPSAHASQVQVQTLKSVGQVAEAAVALSVQLYGSRKITAAQAREVADFYDRKFQPAFRLAVSAVNANLDSFADPEIIGLANDLVALVLKYKNASP
jgi:hypothetical protein